MPKTAYKTPNFKLVSVRGKKNKYISWNENGKYRRVSTGTADPDRAQQQLARFIELWHAPPEANQQTVSKAIDAYLEYKQEQAKDNYELANLRQYASSFKRIKEHLGDTPIRSLTRHHIKIYTSKRRKSVKDPTIRKELTMLTAALNFARKEGWIDTVPYIDKPAEGIAHDKWLKPEEVRYFMQHIDAPHLRLFALLALHTLSRKTAILDLTWDRVDLDRRLIDFNPPDRHPNRKRRVAAPINSKTLYTALLEGRELAQTDYVIEYGYHDVGDIRKSFMAAAERAGLPWVTPHILRHSGATNLAQQGVPLIEIAQLMGDSLKTVEKHYLKHCPDYMANTTKKLAEIYG